MYSYIKRLFDFLAAFIALILLSPIFIVVTILLYIYNNGSPFFYQIRPGKNEKIFKIIKFKSMNDKKGKDGKLLPDENRITSFGKFIRHSSIDEIPQLVNVLKGDMSLVGPRPLLVNYLQKYNSRQKKRHMVTPGITGWAQVNGRNLIDWSKKFELDVWYVENQNFFLDLKILLKTVTKIVASKDISSDTHATMEEFMGNEPFTK